MIAALLVGGLLTAVVLATLSRNSPEPATTDVVTQVADSDKKAKEAKEAKEDRGGPPPWAHAGKSNGKGAADKHAWKEAWKKLTPAQREAKMTALAKEHAEGMRQWSACVEAAAGDAAKRAECTKPLPPGLAKKLP